MRNLDLSPLHRSFIGADHLAQLLKSACSQDKLKNYPPYDIESFANDKYRITIAAAGFSKDEIAIEAHEKKLVVSGSRSTRQEEDEENPNLVHKGISDRNFKRSFQLGDHIRVISADMENGLLRIELERIVPEELKPRKIEIGVNSK